MGLSIKYHLYHTRKPSKVKCTGSGGGKTPRVYQSGKSATTNQLALGKS